MKIIPSLNMDSMRVHTNPNASPNPKENAGTNLQTALFKLKHILWNTKHHFWEFLFLRSKVAMIKCLSYTLRETH